MLDPYTSLIQIECLFEMQTGLMFTSESFIYIHSIVYNNKRQRKIEIILELCWF